MKTFKQFILEAAKLGKRRKIQTFEDLYAYLDEYCTEYLKACSQYGKFILFRGEAHLDTNFSMGVSTEFVRKSANTDNWYSLWIDNSPKWKSFPKRLSSFICTNSPSVANDYGYVKIIIPFNDAKIALAPSADMWNSFEVTMDQFYGSYSPETLYEFQKEIGQIWKELNPDKPLEQSNFNVLKTQLNEASYEKISQLPKSNLVKVMLDGMKKHGCENLADVFDFILDPVKNGFKNISISELASIPRNSEVWIEGECIFIAPENLSSSSIEELQDFFSPKKIDASIINKYSSR